MMSAPAGLAVSSHSLNDDPDDAPSSPVTYEPALAPVERTPAAQACLLALRAHMALQRRDRDAACEALAAAFELLHRSPGLHGAAQVLRRCAPNARRHPLRAWRWLQACHSQQAPWPALQKPWANARSAAALCLSDIDDSPIHRPASTPVPDPLRYFFVRQAYGLRNADAAAFAQACRELGAVAHSARLKQHHHILTAAQLRRGGHLARAHALLNHTEVNVLASGCAWAHFEILCERARLHLAQHNPVAARHIAGLASSLADEHGWVPCSDAVQDEFDLPSRGHLPHPAEVCRRIAAHTPGVLFQLESDGAGEGLFTLVSESCHSMWGLPPGVHPLEALLLRMDASATFVSSLKAAQRHLSLWTWEGACTVSGAAKWIECIAQPQESSGDKTLWAGMFVDITSRKNSEQALDRALADMSEVCATEQLRAEALVDACAQLKDSNARLHAEQSRAVKQEKSASLARLANGLAHEINNPLAGMMYMFEALRGAALTPSRRDEYMEHIEAGLQRIHHTVHALAQYAQPRAPAAQELDLADVVTQAGVQVQALLNAKKQRLSQRVARHAFRIWADPEQLGQALLNVFRNAIHASPQGATLHVQAEATGAQVALRVLDPGTGIPSQYLHRVCDPFFTTKRQGEGTGLGLAIAARLLEAQTGELNIKSAEGEGTTVTLRLPSMAHRSAR